MSDETKIALEVKWYIENIESWLKNRDDALYSPHFIAETLTNTRWKLSLSPSWQFAEKYVSLILLRDVEDGGPKLIDVNYELSFLKCDGSPLILVVCSKKFAPKTVSYELNLKQVEMLVEKKESYLSEGVLTVCCKLWKSRSALSKGRQSSVLKSIIGTKHMSLNASVEDFNDYGVVNFLPPSIDITLISLNVYKEYYNVRDADYEFVFNKKQIECKSLCWYSFKLFALNYQGIKREFFENVKFPKSLSLDKTLRKTLPCTRGSFTYTGKVNLQLYVSYHPAVVSECTESKFNNNEDLRCGTADTEDLKACDSKENDSGISNRLALTDPCIHEGQSSEEDECFDADAKSLFPLTTLKEDLTSLYNDKLFCDTKLQTGTETFTVHRNVLSARSPVFKKMFTTDMKEKAGECITIPDITADTARRLLQFLYTDYTGDMDMQSAKDLYIASDKYDIGSLKARCSSFMKKNLCPANVCEVLVLADMHQDKNLESAAQQYVLVNDGEVFYSEEWKLFMKNYSALAAHVMFLKCTKN